MGGLDEKKPNWVQHQGHHLLTCKSVGHLLLIPEPREHEKFLLWGRVFRTIQWSRWWWWWSRVNVDVGSSNSGGQASSAWSSRGIGGEQCSSTWSSSSRGYR